VAYNLADFLNRMAFGAAMLSAAMLAAPAERSEADLI